MSRGTADKEERTFAAVGWSWGHRRPAGGRKIVVNSQVNALDVGKDDVDNVELFNLAKDVGEKDNLAETMPDMVKERIQWSNGCLLETANLPASLSSASQRIFFANHCLNISSCLMPPA